MTYAGVAWDIDGTLIDSEPLHLRALLGVSNGLGVDLSDLPDDHFVGVNLNGVWDVLQARYPSDLTKAEWIHQINAAYAAQADDLVPIPGAGEAVRELARRGIPQAAVSNSNRIVVDANLARLGVADLFDVTLSLDDVTAPKPDPDPYLRAARLLGLNPRDILAVEDSATGALSAHRATLGIALLAPASTEFATTRISSPCDILAMVDALK
ncbi:HAD family hydrolase [Oceanibium sediminis]|uniref:HAD family hydrolase n=1 Tax=Oceanibium sediminis TaxID=2026339 RepID=UPI000DD4620D|nr:HAD family phosphatase [Oceanibium sediminis]